MGPRLPIERRFEVGSAVDRLAVRNEHELERKVERAAKRGKRAFSERRRPPYAQHATGCRHPVGEDERALLWQATSDTPVRTPKA